MANTMAFTSAMTSAGSAYVYMACNHNPKKSRIREWPTRWLSLQQWPQLAQHMSIWRATIQRLEQPRPHPICVWAMANYLLHLHRTQTPYMIEIEFLRYNFKRYMDKIFYIYIHSFGTKHIPSLQPSCNTPLFHSNGLPSCYWHNSFYNFSYFKDFANLYDSYLEAICLD